MRRLRWIPLVVFPLGLLGFQGCVSAFFAQPKNVEITRTEVDQVRRDQAEILARLEEITKRLENQAETTATLRADSNQGLEEIRQQIEILRAQLEDQGVQFERIQRRVTGDWTPRSESTTPPPVAANPPDSVRTGEDTSSPPEVSVNDLYDTAYRDFSRGNYRLAITGFQELLRFHPDSDLADNAQYWTGECYYGLGELDEAILEYIKVRDLYPKGDKVAAATLKTGYAFLRKGDTAAARRYFETVVREFPKSDEAALAKDKLESLR